MTELDELRLRLEELGRIVVDVKVSPKSSRTELAGRLGDGTLKIRVAAAPEKGRANAELCDYLARQLGVPRSAVRVETGQTSSRKRLSIVSPR